MGEWQAVARYHVETHGWKSLGYHEGISPDGQVFQLANPDAMVPGVAGRNHRYYYICFMGNFEVETPTEAALATLRHRLNELRHAYGPLPLLGHRDVALPGHGTACPGQLLWERLGVL